MDNVYDKEAMSELYSINDMLRFAMSRFNEAEIFYGHGTDNAWDEALQLVLLSLFLPMDIDRSLLESRLTTTEKKLILTRIQQRINERIPVPYLTNKAWFCGLEFYVDERVLVPRSPIAELIEAQFKPMLDHEPTHILDLCTGSACIAIACAYAFPDAEVDAIDISPDALQVAEINVEQHGLENQVTPIQNDLTKDFVETQYDFIVTNPPYVDKEDMDTLPSEYLHEPELGLSAGYDGLDLVRRILANAPRYLKEGGFLVCEVGNSMVHLQEQYPKIPFTWLEFERGGHGVFLLTKDQLLACTELFVDYLD